MGEFVKGDVVVVPFPFSDLTQSKRRPALVLAAPGGDDLILAQITSQTVRDAHAMRVADSDFCEGSLKRPSNVRPNRLFTADRRLILYRAGRLHPEPMNAVTQAVVAMLLS